MLVGWRTWVYARRWRVAHERGWRAVLEAGAARVVPPLMVLAPGIVFRPMEAPPYVIAYGGLGLRIGLTLGVFFRITALRLMTLTTPHQL
jgi:hypothetical protein